MFPPRSQPVSHWTEEVQALYRLCMRRYYVIGGLQLIAATSFVTWRFYSQIQAALGPEAAFNWPRIVYVAGLAFMLSMLAATCAGLIVLIVASMPRNMRRKLDCGVPMCPCDRLRDDLVVLKWFNVAAAVMLLLLCLTAMIVPYL